MKNSLANITNADAIQAKLREESKMAELLAMTDYTKVDLQMAKKKKDVDLKPAEKVAVNLDAINEQVNQMD